MVKNNLNTDERLRHKELERENRELRRSNDILRQVSAYFAWEELDRQCCDEELRQEVDRVYAESKRLYGIRKVWLPLRIRY